MNVKEARQQINKVLSLGMRELSLSSRNFAAGALKLSQKDLIELIPEIIKIPHLEVLDLSNNHFTYIPKELCLLTNIQVINLSTNLIFELPKEISLLQSLRELYLGFNNITVIPKELRQLYNLRKLILIGNLIEALPEDIYKLEFLEELDLRSNKSIENKIPIEILNDTQNPRKIINFYLKIKGGYTRPINEAKVVVIGEANVGKTCLINRLIFDKILPTSSTHGIEIHKWEDVRVNSQPVRLNIWDFGGQEIMHSTHQFFFTSRTIYILVVNARENEDGKIEEWLKRIESFGGNSPIIVVGNKIDENDRNTELEEIGFFEINREMLLGKYKNIKGFYGISSDDSGVKSTLKKQVYSEVFDLFRASLLDEIGKLERLHHPFPADWYEVKEMLEEMQNKNIPYISYSQYMNNCIGKDINDEISQTTIVEFLNEIGTIIYFKDLPDTMVFNPEWITKGVYAIVDNPKIIKNKGEFEISELSNILSQNEYPEVKHKYILNIMRKFELCVDVEDHKRFIIPDLLPLNESYTGEWNNTLYYQFHYDTYLKNVFTKFIVRMFKFISLKTYWRNGVVLELEGSSALVKADPQERKITIQIQGENVKKRQNLLAVVCYEIRQINSTFKFRKPSEYIAHPKYSDILKDYEELIGMENLGDKATFVKELGQKLPISEFLDGISDKDERRKKASNENYITMIENQYNINESQISSIGNENKISDNTFNQQNNTEAIDMLKLSDELRLLRESLVNKATEPEHFISIGNIAQAEQAAQRGESQRIAGYLKSAGEWAFETAKEIGVDIVTDLIKKQL